MLRSVIAEAVVALTAGGRGYPSPFGTAIRTALRWSWQNNSQASDTSWSGDLEKPGRIPLLPVPNRPKPEQRPSSGKDPLEALQPAENKLIATMTLLLEAWTNHSTGPPWRPAAQIHPLMSDGYRPVQYAAAWRSLCQMTMKYLISVAQFKVPGRILHAIIRLLNERCPEKLYYVPDWKVNAWGRSVNEGLEMKKMLRKHDADPAADDPSSAPPQMDNSQQQQQQQSQRRRSKSGCNTCRARKVKCDERPEGCANCERLQLECSGYGRSAVQRSGTRRARRTYRSCTNCRLRRAKCSGERPAYLGPSALLHIVCALGAHTTCQQLSPEFILRSGRRWAEKAYEMVLKDLDKISVDNLMASQLLYDYALRVGNFAQAFMLGGITARMVQALQLNLEYSTDVLCTEPGLSISAREARRRLMWSCFVTDALLGSGVDQLMLIDERDIKIQLPCNERRFVQETACVTRTLDGGVLGFLQPDTIPINPDENMGIMAYFVQHIQVRKQVLRYIKHLDTAISPWLPNSEFAILDKACWKWYDNLPESLQFTTSTIYARKASSQLGALVLLHCSHYQTLCDLYRLGAPALFKLRSAIDFPPEQSEFLQKLRGDLYNAARTLATIIGEAERHGPYILSDTWLPTITYDSSRIMLYYLTQLIDPREQDSKELVVQTIPYLESNIRALKAMQPLNAVSERLARKPR
ncbi:hypothetical protein AN9376.2 [Aspergillus nidulans FGSC A4]|nr:hypothetical protein AN9376.2 [Aspergillus nidulans FGSC A4]|eukprot:XP_682645.1 hypothetical protein AN9376.2 [Aspergillus nidulans FGSC A4]